MRLCRGSLWHLEGSGVGDSPGRNPPPRGQVVDSANRQTRSELLRRTAAAALGLVGLHRLAGPVTAAALAPSVATRDEPLGHSRHLSADWRLLEAREAPPFHLLGLHWQGPGLVEYRTRSAAGAWGEWNRAVEHEQADAPGERSPSGWALGSPAWVGVPSDAVQYRLAGNVRRVRAHFVWSPTVQSRRLATVAAPFVKSRADWGADETIVRADPYYADRLLLAIVHHTAGKAPATPDDSAALIRAIQLYHVESNGWNDIGYNLVVDPFGQAFEGRVGGVERNVVGAHAGGFNAGSCGIALLGNLERTTLTAEARAALVALLAWRLDVGHVDPLGQPTYVSSGTPRLLRAVSGHRDVNSTACPGENLYAELDGMAGEAAVLGLPKLYEPTVTVDAAQNVTFQARLSEPRSWTVTVTNETGGSVASRAGNGSTIDWTWAAGGIPTGVYRYAIEAGADVRPATGRLPLGEDPGTVEPPPRPPRPGGVPRRIPAWAWALRRWQLTPKAERGQRPASAPRRLPSWYWPWFRWQSALKRWEEQYGGS